MKSPSLLEYRWLSGSLRLEGICHLRFHLHLQDTQDFNEDLELLKMKETLSSKSQEPLTKRQNAKSQKTGILYKQHLITEK